ncbi:carbohydrate ABC transporter membrane protein 2 (CUT1 family) [Murinocardiopsis flavida]|uniref:Carbohydrate ABC transporter membrane protein 2 (CUT1 family) n=1 Tax=Murinocardiopsis flavida TaxID=645275 RepID=A0A2P8CW52_9ACTN|nr:carbohydrate ABC transporter permease [Murinocardiopsis flavida]PSK89176.1 carbohydrate ABC transporter membrane protein 2 (CUT1 family) [Murinocardiopsis flavida]
MAAVDTRPAAARPTRPARRRSAGAGGRGLKGFYVALATVLAVVTVFPLLWMITSSFKGPDEVVNGRLTIEDPTFDNYVYVFTQVPFLRYLANSLFVSVVVTVVALFFHSMAAYALARLRFRGRETVFVLVFSTLLITIPAIIIPLFLIVRELGMLNSYAGLIVPAVFNAFGIFLLRQFYLSVPDELEEAARIDGAGYWRVYWSVILPLSRPIFSALAVFFFLANWNSFVWPMIITSDQALTVVQLGISGFQDQYGADWNYVIAASTVAALPTMLVFFVFQRQIVDSIKTTGLK